MVLYCIVLMEKHTGASVSGGMMGLVVGVILRVCSRGWMQEARNETKMLYRLRVHVMGVSWIFRNMKSCSGIDRNSTGRKTETTKTTKPPIPVEQRVG